MSLKGKKRRMDPACLTCAHGGVCRRVGTGRCHDYIDRERYREISPCGETRIWWIAENELDTVACELLPNPRVMEEVVNVELWGYDAEGRLWAMIDNDMVRVGSQYLYLDRESAEVALRTGAWRETV